MSTAEGRIAAGALSGSLVAGQSMIRFITMAAVAALALAGPASAFDVKATKGKTSAYSQGGASSQSGAAGVSIGNGVYLQAANNNSQAAGVVDARNGNKSSTVTQVHATNSTSTVGGLSLGNAAGGSIAGGGAESYGEGAAKQRTRKLGIGF